MNTPAPLVISNVYHNKTRGKQLPSNNKHGVTGKSSTPSISYVSGINCNKIQFQLDIISTGRLASVWVAVMQSNTSQQVYSQHILNLKQLITGIV